MRLFYRCFSDCFRIENIFDKIMVKKLSNQTERKDGAIRVKDLRHKLLSQGNQALTEIELLTLVLNYRGNCKIEEDGAAKIFNFCQNQLREFSNWNYDMFRAFQELDDDACAMLIAIWELSNRRWRSRDQFPTIKSSFDAFDLFVSRIGMLGHEEFHVAYLNRGNQVMRIDLHSKGGLSATVVDIRIVIHQAVMLKASAILVAHNHPSGSLEPSSEDRDLTSKLLQAASFFDIKLLDHLILSGSKYYSFADDDQLKMPKR
jgi:DNA repair protein RadC